MREVIGFDIAVKNSSFHFFDYNPFIRDDSLSSYFMSLKNIYAMKQFWFKALLGIFMLTVLGTGALLSTRQAEAFQDVPTPTGIFVTVIYSDPINVRSGPSTISYPIVAKLNPGEVVPALGISPGREWIQISYNGSTGWVYASFVSISGGELRIIEPPPTPTPLVTATIDPTLAAAFNVQPTLTRLPTFTPPPPLEEIDMSQHVTTPRTVAPGIFIVALGLLGGVGLLISFLLRR
jgi:Bacterial SH3 domain